MDPIASYRLADRGNLPPEAEIPDLLLYAVGYESRASKMREKVNAHRNAAFLYNSMGILSYDRNYNAFVKRGDIELPMGGASLQPFLEGLLPDATGGSHVLIDVSCLDRRLIAESFSALLRMGGRVRRITVAYTPGRYQPPKVYLMPARYFGPASPSFAADVGIPDRESCLIMGLGYEYGAALSAIEIVDPDFGFYFYPVGRVPEYEPAVRHANFDFDFGVGDYQVSPYSLEDPLSVHGRIRDIVESFIHRATISIVPFGPKLFSSVAVLIALRHPKAVSFLRYSVEGGEVLRDTEADDYDISYDIQLPY